MQNNIENIIEELIEKQGFSLISSIDAEGYPNTKAMLLPRKRDGIRVFYFTTNTSSLRVAQYRQNPKACLYFCDQQSFRGIMLKGTMDVLEDATSKQMIWREGDTLYYPLGITDPDYCVLRFTAESGRCYGNLRTEAFTVG